MQQFSNFLARPFSRSAFALLLLFGALSWSLAASAQHTSTQCTAKAGTVTRGGTTAIDVTSCAVNIAFAGTGVVDGPALPAHGKANLRLAGSKWLVDYTHNGNNAGSDVFEFSDGTVAGNTVRVTVTISKARAQ